MRMRHTLQIRATRRIGLAWMAVMIAASAAAVEIETTVADDADTARTPGVVTTGIPFARGAVDDVARLSVSVDGKRVPAQFIELAPWPDGSVRWALMDTQVDLPAGGKATLVVRDDGGNVAPKAPVKVKKGRDAVTVSSGPLQFTIDLNAFNLFKSITVDGKEQVTGGGKGLVIVTKDGKRVGAARPDEVTVEQAGPMKAIVCLRGKYPGLHDGLLRYTVRITAYAGRRFVKLHAWLQNEGAHGYTEREGKPNPEWFTFDGMAVELGLGLGGELVADCEGVQQPGKLKVLQVHRRPIDRHHQGWRFDDFLSVVSGDRQSFKRGERTDGLFRVRGRGGTLTAAVRHFWQQYEKAIELDGQMLRLWLWPTEGEYPRHWLHHVVPGYARRMMLPLRKPGLYNMPGAIHKGHEIILDFSGRPTDRTHAELSRPLFAVPSAEYVASTEAVPGLFTPPGVRTEDEECNAKLDAWTRMTRAASDPGSPYSVWSARKHTRRKLFWYGWMDFGDLAVPGSVHVSLHYDWPWLMLLNTIRLGDLNALRLATQMARHRIDIDQQWSDRDKPRYRGLQRVGSTYAHFHCTRFTRAGPNVIDNWLAGVVLYYLMTGEPKALECIERNSQALVQRWQWVFDSDDYYVRRVPGNMQGVARAIFSYIAMHALTGEKVWLDRAEKMVDRCVMAKWKEYGPHLHDRKQIRSQSYTRDDVKYCYSIHAFCLLHHLTGHKKLFELLQAGCKKDFPENFFDAPLFLADLHAYVALKTGDEDLLDDAVEQWIQAFPESKSPPVFLPNNSQWSRRKAMFLRTGHLLQYAHWKWKKAK